MIWDQGLIYTSITCPKTHISYNSIHLLPSRMPEIKELIHAILRACQKWNDICHNNLSTCRVKALHYDATDTEQSRFKSDSRHGTGLVDLLCPSHNVQRGSCKNQTALWPSMITTSVDLQLLELTEIKGSYRSIMLVFGDVAVLQVSNIESNCLMIPDAHKSLLDRISSSHFRSNLHHRTMGACCIHCKKGTTIY